MIATTAGICAHSRSVRFLASRIVPRYMFSGITGTDATYESSAPARKRRPSDAGVSAADRNGSSADVSAA